MQYYNEDDYPIDGEDNSSSSSSGGGGLSGSQAMRGGGSVVSAIGAIREGNSNAAVAEYNANVANQQATYIMQEGAERERRDRIQSGKMLGNMQAAYGASGVTSDGSALDVMRSSAATSELNALTIRHNADIRATALRNEAALDYYRANNDRTAGYLNAAGDLFSGAAKMAGG